MNVLVNSKQIECEKITVRELGFGQPIDNKEVLTTHYEICMDFSEFSQIIEVEYDKFVQEIEEDDKKTGDTSDEIHLSGYAKFSELSQIDKKLLIKITKEYLYLIFLRICFGNNNPNKCKYAINNLNKINIESEKVIISGEAYQLVTL